MQKNFMSTSAKPLIVGISGTLSSGKDTLSAHLESERDFLHMSTSDMLRAEKKRVFGDSPESLLKRADPFANKLREDRGAGVLVELAYEALLKSGKSNIVISGIRTIGEVEMLHKLGGTLFFVDADDKVRYNRVASRGRDVQDNMSFEGFLAQERSESEGIDPTDKTIQNLPAMRSMADYIIYNNDDPKAFIEAAEKIIFQSI